MTCVLGAKACSPAITITSASTSRTCPRFVTGSGPSSDERSSVRILAVNPGSSSLKLSLIGDRDDTIADRELGDPTDPATERGIDDFLSEVGSPDAVGYRIVHGGTALRRPVLIDDSVRRELDAAAALA